MTQTATGIEQELIGGIRGAFASTEDPMTQAHTIAGLLRDAFERGWPENSEKFGAENGTYEIYRDAEHGHPDPGFVVLAYRQPPQKPAPPSPHDHGICFVVYGVARGSNVQTRYAYQYSDDRSETPKLTAVKVVLQEPGGVDYFLPGEIHSTQGSTEEETVFVRVTSMDLDDIQRHRYNPENGRSRAFSTANMER